MANKCRIKKTIIIIIIMIIIIIIIIIIITIIITIYKITNAHSDWPRGVFA